MVIKNLFPATLRKVKFSIDLMKLLLIRNICRIVPKCLNSQGIERWTRRDNVFSAVAEEEVHGEVEVNIFLKTCLISECFDDRRKRETSG